MTLIQRFDKLCSARINKRGNSKYLLPPDEKDGRWGIEHFGGCEPISERRAGKLIAKMEKEQRSQTEKGGSIP